MSFDFEQVPLLLATGQGRSGTTVLTKALAEHPDIYSNRVESNVLKDVLLAGRLSSSMTSRIRQMVLTRDDHDMLFREFATRLLFPAEGWHGAKRPVALSTFSAMNAEAAEFAIEAFPGIHFANIVRHGVEVVASRMAHRVMGSETFEQHCLAWAAAMEMAKWGEGRNNFTLLRHDHLLNADSCRDAFSNLFDKAGLPDSTNVADYVLNKQFNQTSYENESPDSDLSKRKERWNHWDEQQRGVFKEICGEAMSYFKYVIPADD